MAEGVIAVVVGKFCVLGYFLEHALVKGVVASCHAGFQLPAASHGAVHEQAEFHNASPLALCI